MTKQVRRKRIFFYIVLVIMTVAINVISFQPSVNFWLHLLFVAAFVVTAAVVVILSFVKERPAESSPPRLQP